LNGATAQFLRPGYATAGAAGRSTTCNTQYNAVKRYEFILLNKVKFGKRNKLFEFNINSSHIVKPIKIIFTQSSVAGRKQSGRGAGPQADVH